MYEDVLNESGIAREEFMKKMKVADRVVVTKPLLNKK
jgi:hypothetical protein